MIRLEPGTPALVEVRLLSAADGPVAALQMSLAFAPSVVELTDPNLGSVGAPAFAPLGGLPSTCEQVRGVLPCPDPLWLLTQTGRQPLGTSRTEPGALLIAYATSGVDAPPEQTGALALIEVTALQAGADVVAIGELVLGDASDPPNRLNAVADPLLVIVGDGQPDLDGDSIPDAIDNCTAVPNPEQLDPNRDGFGSLCDADLNDDGFVDFLDLGILKSRFFSGDAAADLNGDGIVDFLDLGLLKALFFQPPGPSGRVP